ncbi:MAG: hypothetical protein PHY04_02270 [Candidatus ainarchaeum sp.]|mgnify:CR=1 FL=1|jgi:hypothetical protein|nr:hypothetical protein [Candidatus ainarchaeum sp.]MDD3085738.1 hypothetical protein [Candidatus ainarchaeum sp.]MDD4128538.1 hypothetical protein [Candidatus ainarchaeum sp.]HPM85582.1 hypothetical protein [archaeon]
MSEVEKEVKLCRYLLGKYAEVINEHERRTIGEIKALVDGTDLSIQSIISDFKDPSYSFQEDYLIVLKKVFDYVQKEIEFVDVDLNVSYWFSPKEIIEAKVADDEDLAIFLCALMKALGDSRAEVIIAELDDLKTHAFVITEFKEDFILLDPAQKNLFENYFGKKAEVLKNYSFKNQKIKRFLYRFNSEKYEQFLE